MSISRTYCQEYGHTYCIDGTVSDTCLDCGEDKVWECTCWPESNHLFVIDGHTYDRCYDCGINHCDVYPRVDSANEYVSHAYGKGVQW